MPDLSELKQNPEPLGAGEYEQIARGFKRSHHVVLSARIAPGSRSRRCLRNRQHALMRRRAARGPDSISHPSSSHGSNVRRIRIRDIMELVTPNIAIPDGTFDVVVSSCGLRSPRITTGPKFARVRSRWSIAIRLDARGRSRFDVRGTGDVRPSAGGGAARSSVATAER